MDEKELINRFTYHAPHGDQAKRYTDLRDLAKEYAMIICEMTPESREQALALTHLEQAVFWANAAIARNEVPGAAMATGTGGGGSVDEAKPAVADNIPFE